MKHTPNVVPAPIRLTLAVCAVGLLAYMCAGLATGYTYIPGKRGGFLLSAIPTLLIVGAASALFLTALLTIVDHYDKRPNEPSYSAARRLCLKAALYLFVAAPFIEVAQRLLLLLNIDVFPHLHGLAEDYTFYSSEMNRLARHVDPILNNGVIIALLSAATGGVGILVNKYSSNFKRLAAALVALSMLGISSLMLAKSTQSFFTGEVKTGSRYNKDIVHADKEPAKFNAILLTHFSLGGILLTASAFLLVGTATGRLKH